MEKSDPADGSIFGGASEQEPDDVPWADPAIQEAYEAALGRVILAHNALDYYLGIVLEIELERRNLADIESLRPHTFEKRLRLLQQLSPASQDPYVRGLRYDDMLRLNADRNNLAHGYFDQNPFDGDYEIVVKGKRHDYPVARLEAIRLGLQDHADRLREAYLLSYFDELPEL